MLAVVAVAMLTVSCGGKKSDAPMTIGIAQTSDDASLDAQESTLDAQLNGNTLTYGQHSYTVNGDIDFSSTDHKTPTASVVFSNFPTNYEEFAAVYNGLLGKSMQGAAAMIPMAIELYARDAEVGERAFQLLCNSQSTVNSIVRILKTKLVPSQYAPKDDPYLQRYMAAALLKGATADNAYTPQEPYTVEMCASVNKPQRSTLNNPPSTVYYLYIIAHGWDTFQRAVQVSQEDGSELYKVFNCPSCYTQCKNIRGDWPGLK